MKKIYKIIAIGFLTLGIVSSCSDDFGDINTHPEEPTVTVPDYVFTDLIRHIGYQGNQNLYLYNPQTLPITRLATTLPSDNMDELSNASGVEGSWREFYDRLANITELKNLIAASPSDPERHRNQLAMVDILRVYYAFRTLDKFGDIPYFEAGKGLSDLNFRPVYDSQGAIYEDLLSQLATATSSIVETADTPAGEGYFDFDANDKLYPGASEVEHFTQWKKFGNSLILKYALRYSKFNQASAQGYIQGALQGPLMSSVSDGAQIVPFDLNGYNNDSRRNAWAWARYYGPTSQPAQFLASKLVTAADISHVDPNTDNVFDPRFFGIYWPNRDGEYRILPNSPDDVAAEGPDLGQADLYLNGENSENIIEDHTASGYNASHAIWNRMYTMSIFQAQKMLTYQEHLLVLAEIYASGLATGDAQAAYESGIRVAVEEFFNRTYAHYPDNNTARLIEVTSAEIDALIADPAVAFSADSATALEQIRTQRWIDYLYQPDQAWSLIRRTNLFDLDNTVPLVNSGTTVSMIYRMKYPIGEQLYNTSNYLEQLNKMGGTDDIRYIADIFK